MVKYIKRVCALAIVVTAMAGCTSSSEQGAAQTSTPPGSDATTSSEDGASENTPTAGEPTSQTASEDGSSATSTASPTPEPGSTPSTGTVEEIGDEALTVVRSAIDAAWAAQQAGFKDEDLNDDAQQYYTDEAQITFTGIMNNYLDYQMTLDGEPALESIEIVDVEETDIGPSVTVRTCLDFTGTELVSTNDRAPEGTAGRVVVDYQANQQPIWFITAITERRSESC